MRRTITINKNGCVHYGNRAVGYPTDLLRKSFKLKNNKRYSIIIVKGTQYQIYRTMKTLYGITDVTTKWTPEFMGVVCKNAFDKLFFKADGRKRYDITIVEKK